MINYVFDLCVRILIVLANACGMTYKAINVWIFVVIWPIFTLFVVGLVIHQRGTIRRLRAERGAENLDGCKRGPP